MPHFIKPAEGSWTEHYPELGTEPVSYEDSISPDFYELERDAIFKRAWLNVGRVEQLRRNGSYFTKEIQVAIRRAFADASPPIRVRIGVHTGDVLQDEARFFGTTVNYAARVASHALGGEVLVSRVVHDLAQGGGIEFLESRDVELKGLEGTHRLFAVAVA